MYLAIIDVATEEGQFSRVVTDDPTLKDKVGFLIQTGNSAGDVYEVEVEYDPDWVHHLVGQGGPY
jgi:hypothetical protein